MGRAGGTTTALDGVSGSWYVNQVGDERFRHLQREVNFWSIHVLVHRHDRHGGPEREGRRRVRVQCRFVVEVWRQGFDSGVSVWGHGEV